MTCPDLLLLRRYAADKLAGFEREAVTRHLMDCAACQARVQQMEPVHELQSSPSPVPSEPAQPASRAEHQLASASRPASGGSSTSDPAQAAVPLLTSEVSRLLWAAAAVLLGAGLMIGLAALWQEWNTAHEAEPVYVTGFEVLHFRPQGTTLRRLPVIGSIEHTPAMVGDQVSVSIRLSKPGYCYLLSFAPDGKEALCFPDDATLRPPPIESVQYPVGEVHAPLTSGGSLQVFVLLASPHPLPPFAEWKTRVGSIPWRPAPAQGVWRWESGRIERLESSTPGPRWQTPLAFEELCLFLKGCAGVETMQALGFAVLPNPAGRP